MPLLLDPVSVVLGLMVTSRIRARSGWSELGRRPDIIGTAPARFQFVVLPGNSGDSPDEI